MSGSKILQRWGGFSLKYRIAIIIFILEALMMATVLGVTLTYSLNESRKHLEVKEQVLLNLLGDLSRIALLTTEYDELQPYIEQVDADPHVVTVLLINTEDRVVVSNEHSMIGRLTPELLDTESSYWKSNSIENINGLLGSLAIRFSNKNLIQTNKEVLNLGIRTALTGMILIAVVGIIIGFLLTRRIDKLTTTAKKLADGDFDVRLNMPGQDELSIVSEAFNHMAENVERNIEELRTTNQALEKSRVALREMVKITSAPDLSHEERLNHLLDTGREYFGLAIGVLASVENNEKKACKISGDESLIPNLTGPLCDQCALQLVERHGEPLDIPNFGRVTGCDEVCTQDGWKSYIGTAVLVEGKAHCTLEFAGTEIRDSSLSTWDHELLKVMAQWIGDELERQVAYESQLKHQSEFARVSRMSTIGEMAASLAHELNQPLTGAINYSSGCLRLLREGERDTEKLIIGMEQAVEGATLAADIIRNIRQFVQKDDQKHARLNLNEAVMNVMALITIEAQRHDVVIKLDLADELPMVKGNMIQLEQVILNFIRNGFDAMDMVESNSRCMTITARVDNGMVKVAIADTGEGIPDESLAKIFDAFYTTKEDGMGIGLSISRSIIESHQGKIMAKSLLTGAEFAFELPVAGNA